VEVLAQLAGRQDAPDLESVGGGLEQHEQLAVGVDPTARCGEIGAIGELAAAIEARDVPAVGDVQAAVAPDRELSAAAQQRRALLDRREVDALDLGGGERRE